MKILENSGSNALSTDLTGFEKYLENLGISKRQIGFPYRV